MRAITCRSKSSKRGSASLLASQTPPLYFAVWRPSASFPANFPPGVSNDALVAAARGEWQREPDAVLRSTFVPDNAWCGAEASLNSYVPGSNQPLDDIRLSRGMQIGERAVQRARAEITE